MSNNNNNNNNNINNNTITNHYENIALDAYKCDVLFTKTKEYKYEVQRFIIDLLGLQRKSNNNNNDNDNNKAEHQIIVDLGGGMGDFCYDLKNQLHENYSFLCVDPSKDLINEAKRNDIDSINADAIQFSLLDNKYDIIILKEMIHHIPIDSLTKLFQNISKQLNDNGLILIVTRPVHTDFPFFEKVKKIWSTTQPDLSLFTSSLLEANYNIEVIEWDYFVTMKKDNWYKFIKNRSFSEFSLCTDNELEEGIQELEVKYKDTDTLKFNDKLLLIIARKK